jgi:nucleoside-diphosphate-sugar epimerase
VGPSRGAPAGTVISGAALNILDGMRRHGVRRLVFTSGLMVGEARGVGLVQRLGLAVFRRLNGALYRDKVAAERLVRESEMEWIIIRPPLFGDRSPRGSWRMGEDLDVPMGAMSAADVAGALLQALGEERFLRKAVEIGY